MLKWRRESVLDIYNLVLALVLFASPWLLDHASTTVDVDLWVSAVAIGAISVAAMLAFTRWDEWANLVLGLWLIVSPWLLGFTHTNVSAMHFSIGIGIVVAFMAALELWLVSDTDDASTPASAHEQQDRALFH